MYRNFSAGPIGIRLPFEECVTLAHKTGFQGIDVGGGEVTGPLGPTGIRELLAKYGLQYGAAGLPVDFRNTDEAFEQGFIPFIDSLPRLAELPQTRMLTWLLPYSEERDYRINFQVHKERLGRCAREMEKYGIRLGLEFVGPATMRRGKKYEFIHRLDQVLELCAAIGTTNMGILLDSWHWYTSHLTVEDIESLTDKHIVGVHINDAPAGIAVDEQVDNVRCLPGETGVINLKGFLGTLKKIGYTGPVTVEPFSKRVSALPPEESARETSEALKKVWRNAGLD